MFKFFKQTVTMSFKIGNESYNVSFKGADVRPVDNENWFYDFVIDGKEFHATGSFNDDVEIFNGSILVCYSNMPYDKDNAVCLYAEDVVVTF